MASTEKRPACENCRFRLRAEANPRTLFAWLWRVHTHICPGWKAYQRWLKAEAGKTSAA